MNESNPHLNAKTITVYSGSKFYTLIVHSERSTSRCRSCMYCQLISLCDPHSTAVGKGGEEKTPVHFLHIMHCWYEKDIPSCRCQKSWLRNSLSGTLCTDYACDSASQPIRNPWTLKKTDSYVPCLAWTIFLALTFDQPICHMPRMSPGKMEMQYTGKAGLTQLISLRLTGKGGI